MKRSMSTGLIVGAIIVALAIIALIPASIIEEYGQIVYAGPVVLVVIVIIVAVVLAGKGEGKEKKPRQ